MRFVVYGAGAVGSVLGGHLALRKHEVVLVARERHARAIRDQHGLRMRSATGQYIADLRAATSLEDVCVDGDTIIFLTVKSNHTEKGVEGLARAVPGDTPIVSFQNGVSNEETIARKFSNVFGGVCRMTCSFLQPGQVSFRSTGRLVVGKYPKGVHALAKKLGRVFADAGFDTSVSNSIMCDKWLKLVANLQSAFNAIIDTRDHDTPEFTELKAGVLEEARAVLKADKIRAKSCDGRDYSIDDVIDDLRKPHANRPMPPMRVNNSTWQNLYLKRPFVENRFFHDPIIALGRKHGIAVPFNETALALVTKCCDEQAGPNTLRAAEILSRLQGGRAN